MHIGITTTKNNKGLNQRSVESQLDLNTEGTPVGLYEHIVNSIHVVDKEMLGKKDKTLGETFLYLNI